MRVRCDKGATLFAACAWRAPQQAHMPCNDHSVGLRGVYALHWLFKIPTRTFSRYCASELESDGTATQRERVAMRAALAAICVMEKRCLRLFRRCAGGMAPPQHVLDWPRLQTQGHTLRLHLQFQLGGAPWCV